MVEHKTNYPEARQILYPKTSGPTYASVAANVDPPAPLDTSALLRDLLPQLLPQLIISLIESLRPVLLESVSTLVTSLVQPLVDRLGCLDPPRVASVPPPGCSSGPASHSACVVVCKDLEPSTPGGV